MAIIFQFLLQLGLLILVFQFGFTLILMLGSAAFAVARLWTTGFVVLRAIQAYFLGALVALVSLFFVEFVGPNELKTTLPIIGGLVVFFTLVKSVASLRRDALRNENVQMLYASRFDGLFPFIGGGLFLVFYFSPALAANDATIWIFDTIGWIQRLPMIGWIVGGVAALYMLSTIIGAFLQIAYFGAAIALAFGALVGRSVRPRLERDE